MIISASRRTDIPCYYSEWFMNRLKAGYAVMRNPFNNAQLTKIPLSPETVDCIVFWTKDAENIMQHLDEIDRMSYKYYFQFTITPYGKDLEKNLRPKSEIEETFIKLSNRIGKEKTIWRYDPIILNKEISIEWHKHQFRRMCEKLSKYTESVIISFADMYAKLKTPLIREINGEEIGELSYFINQAAKNYGLRAKSCCEETSLEKASCIDPILIQRITNKTIPLKPDKNQRQNCTCAESKDIGAYNTCLNGCIYCYANDSYKTAQRRHNSHNPNNELLIGQQ